MKKTLFVILTACFAFSIFSCASTGKAVAKGEKMESITKESQSIKMEKLGNARELGGYVSQDGRKVKRGLLLRSAKPVSASENDLNRLKNDFHLGTIIDFRMSGRLNLTRRLRALMISGVQSLMKTRFLRM